jgi:CHAT domain-containing protein
MGVNLKTKCKREFHIQALVMICLLAGIVSGQENDSSKVSDGSLPLGIVIQVNKAGQLGVHQVQSPDQFSKYQGPGLVVWNDGLKEHCSRLPWSDSVSPPSAATQAPDLLQLISRGSGSSSAATTEIMTVQLDQLLGRANIRGVGFLTPQGRHLFPEITIRRLPTGGVFPPSTISIYRDRERVVSFPMQAGQQRLTWKEIPDLPTQIKGGLPPGDYTIRVDGTGISSQFAVEEEERRQSIMQRPEEFAKHLGSTTSPLSLTFTLSHLLSGGAVEAKEPYFADALDLLDRSKQNGRTVHLRQTKQRLLQRLGAEDIPHETMEALPQTTGVELIDDVRVLIRRGEWDEAIQSLDRYTPRSSSAAALVDLYRAVALSESGPATEMVARQLFQRSIAMLAPNPANAFLAHNNYACFLLDRMQDRLHNHAFQMSSAVSTPLLHAFADWNAAQHHYHEAQRIAQHLSAGDRASVEVNLARLYALLADVIRSLDDPQNPYFLELEASAAETAVQMADRVIQESSGTDDLTLAVAHEVLAQLAFRHGDMATVEKQADEAERHYLEIGGLAGVESIQRLRGLAALRDSSRADSKLQALRHFQLSHLLSESLRESMPNDTAGLTRAGFLARRAYVNERIIELLLEQQDPQRALYYVELSKARSLQDALSMQIMSMEAPRVSQETHSLDVEEILDQWPAGHAAIEYYIGSESTWCFLIDPEARLQAFQLHDEAGQPIRSRALLRRVRLLLTSLEHQSIKMTGRLLSGQGFDNTWQDELDALRQVLLPPKIIDSLRLAKEVVIVPHHLLHYVPFAALVTQRDSNVVKGQRLAKPRFLIDEKFSLTYAPSLAFWHRQQQQGNRPLENVYIVGVGEFELAPSLPGVEIETEHLRVAFGNRVRQVIGGSNATEQRFRDLLIRRGMLFVATHGMNLADQSFDSHLLLQANTVDDGFLTAREIYQSEGGVDLVVMSACYSGLADRSPLPGDDLFGLQRALLYSGSRAVVSGLWDVYDQTAPMIMQLFMDRLSHGVPVSDALAQTQRQFIDQLRASSDDEPWLHPYFWSVFTVVGDGRVQFKEAKASEEISSSFPPSDAPSQE